MVDDCMGMIPLLLLLVLISFLPEMLVVLATRPKRSLATSHICLRKYRSGGNHKSDSPLLRLQQTQLKRTQPERRTRAR